MNKTIFKFLISALISWSVFFADTSAAQNVTQCRAIFESVPLEGFAVQNGELKLNPETRHVKWRGKSIRLSATQYMILENLILADGAPVTMEAFSLEGERNAGERGSDPAQYAYGKNWVVVNIMRLRKFLSESFDPSFAKRVVTLNGRGFAWTTDKMLADAENYDPARLTYLWDKQRLFKGPNEIFLSPGTALVVDRYVNNSFQLITREGWYEICRRDLRRPMTYNALKIMISKANIELAGILGTEEKIILKNAIRGMGGWSLNSSVFDVESMPRPVRNSTITKEPDSRGRF
jgi:DNA-binding winged helix-turn-helix (wHTH) protein